MWKKFMIKFNKFPWPKKKESLKIDCPLANMEIYNLF